MQRLAQPLLKRMDVNKIHALPEIAPESIVGFWPRLLRDGSLQCRTDLEKLVTGCEIIVALDDLGLLTA